MSVTPRFRALSLDLGETVWWDTPEQGARQDAARSRILSAVLVGPDETPVTPEQVSTEWGAFRTEIVRTGRSHRTVSTRHKIEELARRLRARLTVPIEAAVERFALAGFDTDPPTVNSQAFRLVGSLNRRAVPVVAISNTQRTGEAWRLFLQRARMRFEFVITSSDYEVAKPDPKLFRAASERLGLPPNDILHVGDRWSTDVVGALSVGMGAALYRGLWGRHWDRDEGVVIDPGSHPEVFRWDDLGQAEPYLLERSDT